MWHSPFKLCNKTQESSPKFHCQAKILLGTRCPGANTISTSPHQIRRSGSGWCTPSWMINHLVFNQPLSEKSIWLQRKQEFEHYVYNTGYCMIRTTNSNILISVFQSNLDSFFPMHNIQSSMRIFSLLFSSYYIFSFLSLIFSFLPFSFILFNCFPSSFLLAYFVLLLGFMINGGP